MPQFAANRHEKDVAPRARETSADEGPRDRVSFTFTRAAVPCDALDSP
jgi:hypothetical protein